MKSNPPNFGGNSQLFLWYFLSRQPMTSQIKRGGEIASDYARLLNSYTRVYYFLPDIIARVHNIVGRRVFNAQYSMYNKPTAASKTSIL